ncbi:MAG: hypothetical protein ABI840_06200 [bacterium]
MRFKNLSKIQIGIFALLICISGVSGYLFYDSYRANIRNRELIADTKIENKDLSEDLQIMKDKYDMLYKEVTVLKTKVAKVTYKKKPYKKRKLYSAGKSSKYKYHYKKSRVSYKKLYFELKKKCGLRNRSKSGNYKRK